MEASVPREPRFRKSAFVRVLDLFSSVWTGILWAALLFVYCSIGSAMPAVRQHPALEMTEFEWFHWWPFNLLVVLLCTTLVVVTVRRIPFRPVNFGVWMIHAGILVLCLGSYYYFGTKVEGDTPVFRRRVRIELPAQREPGSLLALPGHETSVAAGSDLWRFQIQSTNSAWPILSAEHQGEKAYAVNVRVTPPNGEAFIRQLLAGYPQYTEDIIPCRGRAVKTVGRKLIREELKLTLVRDPQAYFHVADTWALFVRRVGESEWVQRPIRGLPRYHDRIGSREQVFTDPHDPVPLRSIDLPVPPAEGGDALSGAVVHVTAYLRHALMQRRYQDGGDRLNPVLAVSMLTDHAPPQAYELVAFDRAGRESQDGMMELRWSDEAPKPAALPEDSRAMLHIAVPDADVALDLPLTRERIVGREGPFTEIEGTDFAYRVLSVQDNLVLPGSGKTVSVAMVDLRGPDGPFTRMVADQPAMTRDMRGDHPDPHTVAGPESRKPVRADPRIVMSYQPRSAPIVFVASPEGLYLVVNGPSGRILSREVRLAQAVEVVPGLRVRADAFWSRAVSEVKPYIVPRSARERDAGESFAMIRLEVDTGHQVQHRWLPFHHYVFPNAQYAYPGRFQYAPERFRLSDGTVAEVVFSRQRRKLPHPVALEEFTLDTHLGGYTGQKVSIRNYVSKLSFFDNGRWSDVATIKVNQPTEDGGYWYFQNTWDPPPRDNPSGGMNYTGLGVGNRNGVHIQLAGCCLAVAGMLFAFYVKPVLRRRRYEHSRARVSTLGDEPMATPAARMEEAVEV